MTDAILCDRCNAAVRKTYYKRNKRAEIVIEQHSVGSVGHTPKTYELCEACTNDLGDFLDQ